MKRSKISAKWQIYFFLMVFSGILIGILWLFQIVYLNSFYKHIKTLESKKVYAQLTRMVENGDEDLHAKINEIAGKHNISVLLANENLTNLFYADYNAVSSLLNMPTSMFRELVSAARENCGNYSITFIGDENVTGDDDTITPGDEKNKGFHQNRGQEQGESVIYVALVSSPNFEDEMVLMVNSVMTPITSTVETLKIQLLVITFVLLLLALIIGYIVTNIVSKPIIQMNESAKKLAEGDFSPNFTVRQYKEIAELSDTLNYAAEELGKSEEYQHEIVANVSHDLRTPLTMITGYAEVMRDIPGENTPENIQVIIDEANRLTNLVNDLLNISKLQAGVLEKRDTRYNLTQSIRRVFDRYNKLREQEGYVIEFEASEDVYVIADEDKIFQVVYNLINNAINYTGEDKRVIVRQKLLEDYVRIEVSDSGEGIPETELKNVWERYYKVDKTHKRSVQGTGLGLSIVKNILKLHNARFGVESQIGKGSTFWFELKRG
ncbi:MAG: ATP-binding protein [Lachnospiraceae bacterium]